MDIKELTEELNKVRYSIEGILKKSLIIEYEDCDPNELLLVDEYGDVLNHLLQAYRTLNYLNCGFLTEGVLRMQSNGRYCINNYELSCGYGVEVLIYDDYDEQRKWVASRIEAMDGRYYLVGYPKLELEGLKARIRG